MLCLRFPVSCDCFKSSLSAYYILLAALFTAISDSPGTSFSPAKAKEFCKRFDFSYTICIVFNYRPLCQGCFVSIYIANGNCDGIVCYNQIWKTKSSNGISIKLEEVI